MGRWAGARQRFGFPRAALRAAAIQARFKRGPGGLLLRESAGKCRSRGARFSQFRPPRRNLRVASRVGKRSIGRGAVEGRPRGAAGWMAAFPEARIEDGKQKPAGG